MFSADLKDALARYLPRKTVLMKDWSMNRTGPWRGRGYAPVALFLHHTAAAATESTNPANPGNKRGANDSVISFIQNHYKVPAANFTLDRDGTVYVHSSQAIWHAGYGTFKGKAPWAGFGIPNNDANRWCLGVEIMSKGKKMDFTEAQKRSLVMLLHACRDAARWGDTSVVRRPRHKDWTPRKIDILYKNEDVTGWVKSFAKWWDGVIPTIVDVKASQEDAAVRNDAAWRVACRLKDKGFFAGDPSESGVQGYPAVAVSNYQKHISGEGTGRYGPKTHEVLFEGEKQ